LELKKLKEEQAIAVEAATDNLKKRLEDEKNEFQKKVKEDMVRERNREIEAIINKLGDETHDTQKQLMAQYERKVKEAEAKRKSDAEEYKAQV
jgi:hypothetical protein